MVAFALGAFATDLLLIASTILSPKQPLAETMHFSIVVDHPTIRPSDFNKENKDDILDYYQDEVMLLLQCGAEEILVEDYQAHIPAAIMIEINPSNANVIGCVQDKAILPVEIIYTLAKPYNAQTH